MLSESSNLERPRPQPEGQLCSLLAADVGPHRLVFDLRTLLSIERRAGWVDEATIRGPVDLRDWLGLPPDHDVEGDTVLVPAGDAVYRLVVDRLSQLIQSDLRQVFPMPKVLAPLTEQLCLKGVVVLEGGLSFLVDPGRLARGAWQARDEASA